LNAAAEQFGAMEMRFWQSRAKALLGRPAA
jgi:hypothetical protein